VLVLEPQFSIDLQLIGGVIILQTLPALVLGLWRTFVHRWALLAGWAAGMIAGLYMVYDTPNPLTGKAHFGGAQYELSKLGFGDTKVTIYTGIVALALNLAIVVVGSLVLRRAGTPAGDDATVPDDYVFEPSEPGAAPLPATPGDPEPSGVTPR
jgi:SSS family solute:Na+ symporter